ncbi:MAG: hypothetical protein JJT75_14945 [Opitutales bacterium]|nr:hypothetical protein [Opitutales bacterium]
MKKTPGRIPALIFLKAWLPAFSVSVLVGSFVGSVILQGYFAVFSPSSFGRFAEFPIILIFAALIIIFVHVVALFPASFFIRNYLHRISLVSGGVVGGVIGFLYMLVNFVFSDFGGGDTSAKIAYGASGTVAGIASCVAYLFIFRWIRPKVTELEAQPDAVSIQRREF